MPKKDKKPITSVIVVTKTLEAIAGSIFIFLSETGTNMPNTGFLDGNTPAVQFVCDITGKEKFREALAEFIAENRPEFPLKKILVFVNLPSLTYLIF